MTKHLYRHATRLQEQLLGAAIIDPKEWALKTPRVYLDAWASLWRWHRAGEPIVRLTEEMEGAMLANPLPHDLALATAEVRHEALAVQLPVPGQWIVIARHPAREMIQVQGEVGWAELSPMLTYCAPGATREALHSGYHNLRDQPTLGDLQLLPGKSINVETDAPLRDLSETDVLGDDYALTLAIQLLFQR